MLTKLIRNRRSV